MEQAQALDLIRQLLQAPDEEAVMRLAGQSLPLLDGTFFSTAEAAACELEREQKPAMARALRGLTDHMLRMKTLI